MNLGWLDLSQVQRDRDIQDARAALCDLLIGRRFRSVAEQHLRSALYLESYGHPDFIIDKLVDEAAHCEWLACRSEQGKILWGGRLNRCGYQPRETEE